MKKTTPAHRSLQRPSSPPRWRAPARWRCRARREGLSPARRAVAARRHRALRGSGSWPHELRVRSRGQGVALEPPGGRPRSARCRARPSARLRRHATRGPLSSDPRDPATDRTERPARRRCAPEIDARGRGGGWEATSVVARSPWSHWTERASERSTAPPRASTAASNESTEPPYGRVGGALGGADQARLSAPQNLTRAAGIGVSADRLSSSVPRATRVGGQTRAIRSPAPATSPS